MWRRMPTTALDDRVLEAIERSLFFLSVNQDGDPLGACFFVSPTHAVTCAHLISRQRVGREVFAKNDSNESLKLRVSEKNVESDYAILGIVGTSRREMYLSLADTRANPVKMTDVCYVASYNLALRESDPRFDLRRKITTGSVVCTTANHIWYSNPMFGGDSGAAVAIRDGTVIAMHQEMANEYAERIRRAKDTNARLTAVEESVDRLIQGSSYGYVGLLAHVLSAAVSRVQQQ